MVVAAARGRLSVRQLPTTFHPGFLVHAGRNEAIRKARPVVEPRARRAEEARVDLSRYARITRIIIEHNRLIAKGTRRVILKGPAGYRSTISLFLRHRSSRAMMHLTIAVRYRGCV